MTMPVRPVRVRAGIVEQHCIVTKAAPALDLPAPNGHGGLRHGTKVTLAFRYQLGMRVQLCYTAITLNTAVVWCDGSGAVFDLRTPAFSFPSVRLQRNQN
jgi:hypothetical protein